MYEPNRNTGASGEPSADNSSWSFYNNGGNEGHIVQGHVSGNTFHAPKTPEEVAAKMRDYEAERAKFLKAEKGIKGQVSSFITVGGTITALMHLNGNDDLMTHSLMGGSVIGVLINTVRLWSVRKKREDLSRRMRALE
ncbi:hypothetical protein [Streptomyces luridiscabiei]|uniref:hypothetical protein n=1 Tax=Streptomyces luridiscabiei TaxID=164114 RepID=UPI0006E35EF1|nr:hypothetical protein [Streptomyces luridiscabiei]